jgi:AraC family transcriptional regulator
MALKDNTITDYRERLNRVLKHIRDNIGNPLTLDELAGIACFSPFHFHRIFSAFTGETVSGFIRRIRLDNAAFKLCSSDRNITDIALDAGYDTPAAFSRAFREQYGKTPSDFKRFGGRTYAKQNVIISDQKERKGIAMDVRIMEVNEQNVLFVRKTGRYDLAAQAAWQALMSFAYPRKLVKKETRMIGIGYDNPQITDEDKLRYDACITINSNVVPEGEVGTQTIQGGLYAVCLHKGSYSGLAATYNAIFSRWLPTSGRSLRNAPCWEVYLNRDPRRTKPENLRTEIYIPIE